MPELWKPVVGYEGLYEVSELGRVRSLPHTIVQTNSRGEPYNRVIPGRLLKPSPDRDGYRFAHLFKNGVEQRVKVCKLVLAAFVGPRPLGHVIRHRDGKRSVDTLLNLRYGTQAENLADAREHGTAPIGELHGCAKLTKEDVQKIRELYAADTKLAAISRQFSISHTQAHRIVNNTAWTHI